MLFFTKLELQTGIHPHISPSYLPLLHSWSILFATRSAACWNLRYQYSNLLSSDIDRISSSSAPRYSHRGWGCRTCSKGNCSKLRALSISIQDLQGVVSNYIRGKHVVVDSLFNAYGLGLQPLRNPWVLDCYLYTCKGEQLCGWLLVVWLVGWSFSFDVVFWWWCWYFFSFPCCMEFLLVIFFEPYWWWMWLLNICL